MSQLNLNLCDKACVGCVKGYKKKFQHTDPKWEVSCGGIPKEYLSQDILAALPEDQAKTAISMMDPVTWAAETLDWHCLDIDGEIWKRKNPQEYWEWIKNNPDTSILGKSRYHRPYQAEMLRCTSKYKVSRIGRQSGKTEALVISILFNMFTKPNKGEEQGFKVIVITPYQAQIELIFTRVEELIKSNPNLANSVRRSVKAPNYTITLHNGSIIKGFTAGTKSGGNADSVRGQHGDMLVFDEADYLNPKDMDSALSIITNQPQATVWMSSTPTGRREKFYDTCFSKQWREFHYPSQVNPLWSEKLDRTFKEQLTELGYKHEILAEFGDQEEGVFQNTYIHKAKADYNYGDFAFDHRWFYMIGVDWNDVKNGTTIAVVGLNPDNNTFFIVDRKIISRDGWTQLSACDKIAELNRHWHPFAIYIDKGFGGTQYEILRKFGWDSSRDPLKGATHPDAKLRDIVKQYDFGSKIEVRDLFTKQPVDKASKPFLVENTVRRFETGNIRFPSSDKVLEAQLLNYVIDKVTNSGNPVYKPRNEEIGDHTLDALMLAMVAFTLEKTPLGKPIYRSDVTFSGYFGQRIDPVINEGDLVIKPDKKRKESAVVQNKPVNSRTDGIVGESNFLQSTKQLPANHTTRKTQIALWDWPGFLKDAPPPKSRTGRRALPPSRKKF